MSDYADAIRVLYHPNCNRKVPNHVSMAQVRDCAGYHVTDAEVTPIFYSQEMSSLARVGHENYLRNLKKLALRTDAQMYEAAHGTPPDVQWWHDRVPSRQSRSDSRNVHRFPLSTETPEHVALNLPGIQDDNIFRLNLLAAQREEREYAAYLKWRDGSDTIREKHDNDNG